MRGRDLPKGDPEAGAAHLTSNHLLLVSYETLRRNELSFAPVRWDVMILDEAQKAKDPRTQTARVVRSLKARFRLAMSGTPVENTLRELWTIYDWAVPGLLGSLRKFTKSYIKPLQEVDNEIRRELSRKLQGEIGPVFIRRMKRKTLSDQLPAISHIDHPVPLSTEQRRLYDDCIEERFSGEIPALSALPRLFSLCAHPSMVGTHKVLHDLKEKPFPKGQQLFHILDDVRVRREKALIFANRRRIQRWLADEVDRRYDIEVNIINGQVTESATRMRIIQEFSEQEGFAVLVLAPRAAGLGLNITAANHVIHYMREWNPAIENQATDRTYRIGQTRPVTVYTITATSKSGTTVEENLARLLDDKRRLIEDFTVPMGGFQIKVDDILEN